jgi:hypothetical protein
MDAPIDCIDFHDHREPTLPDGDYVLTVKQQVKIDGKDQWTEAALPSATLNFSVAGPRLTLDPGLIRSQFPPPKSIGEYHNVLPHIILTRATLPWEREIGGASATVKPWMALLLLDQTADKTAGKDVPQPRIVTVQDLCDCYRASAKPAGEPEFVRILKRDETPPAGETVLWLEIAQHLEDRLTVIDVSKRLLWETLPSEDELAWLSHVRMGQDCADPTKPCEYPVILGNRLPAPGSQSSVHLVSLEARQDLLAELKADKAPDDKLVRLVSLASWSFATLQNKMTFSGWINEAWSPGWQGQRGKRGKDPGATHMLRMPGKGAGDKNAERFLAQGYVPIRHQTRQGNHLVSWYRGPLLPGASPDSDPGRVLPARTSDQLVRYFGDVGMLDVTYAAAWELGRMLTLRSKEISVALFNWKRACSQQHQRHQQAEQLRKAKAAVCHLPFAPDHGIAPDLPTQVGDWFCELRRLEHVPFHYLVPHEDMLPPGSLRFFQVDLNWLECLLDGAFSIGRVSSADVGRDRAPPQACCVSKTAGYSGFLLRSPVVAGWPHLGVEAYVEAIAKDVKPTGAAKRLRFDRLGEDILLCLFEGDMRTFDIHEQPEALHFGVEAGNEPKNLAGYSKALRKPDGKIGEPIKLGWKRGSEARRTLDIAKLVTDAKAKSSAAFAVAMIEGVERVRFVKKG